MTMSIFESILNNINTHIENTSGNIEALMPHIAEAIHLFTETILNDRKIICCACPNSIPSAYQFTHQMINGTTLQRPSLPAILLNSQPNNSTATDYNDSFSRQLQALASSDDLLFIISNSPTNMAIEHAISMAQDKHMTIVALLPQQVAHTLKMTNNNVIMSASDSDHTSSLHFVVCQMLATLIEQQLFGNHTQS